MLNNFTTDTEYGSQVGGEYMVKFFIRYFRKVFLLIDACIIYEDIDLAEFVNDIFNQSRNRCEIIQVTSFIKTFFTQLQAGSFKLFFIPAYNDSRNIILRKCFCNSQP